MSLKTTAMKLSAKSLRLTGGQPFRSIYGGCGHILMFHRVMPAGTRERIIANSYLEVTPEFLDWTINYFKSHHYQFLSLDELTQCFAVGRVPKKIVVYTFDDGYKDNLQYAYPVFEKSKVPFCIYVTTDFPDGKAKLWWNSLEHLLLNHDKVEIDLNGKVSRYKTGSLAEKTIAFKEIHRLIKLCNGDELTKCLNQIFLKYDIDPSAEVNRVALSWDEVRELGSESLVTIGAHSVTHPKLTGLSDAEVLKEISESKALIESNIEAPADHFAYPYGGPGEVGSREVEIVAQSGFATAVTTFSANIHAQHAFSLHALPRIAVGMSMTESTFDLIRFGVIPAIRNKARRIVTI